MSNTYDNINEMLKQCKNYDTYITGSNPWQHMPLGQLNDNKLCLKIEEADYLYNPINPQDNIYNVLSKRRPQHGAGIYEAFGNQYKKKNNIKIIIIITLIIIFINELKKLK